MEISIVRGDITRQDVDAIVNAASTELRGGGGVDGAIHRAGGPAILADCIARYPSGLATGQAGWTTAGNLPARWVIHVVGPIYTGTNVAKRHQLSSCYTNALRLADELHAETVAFPLVSAGVYGWPVNDAARAAVQALESVSTRVIEARMVAYSAPAYDALTSALEDRKGDRL